MSAQNGNTGARTSVNSIVIPATTLPSCRGNVFAVRTSSECVCFGVFVYSPAQADTNYWSTVAGDSIRLYGSRTPLVLHLARLQISGSGGSIDSSGHNRSVCSIGDLARRQAEAADRLRGSFFLTAEAGIVGFLSTSSYLSHVDAACFVSEASGENGLRTACVLFRG